MFWEDDALVFLIRTKSLQKQHSEEHKSFLIWQNAWPIVHLHLYSKATLQIHILTKNVQNEKSTL